MEYEQWLRSQRQLNDVKIGALFAWLVAGPPWITWLVFEIIKVLK